MFGHPSRFYVQMSIVTDVVTIDILDHFYAQMSSVTDVVTIDILDHFYARMSILTNVVTIDILDHSAMMHCCIWAQVIDNKIIVQ